MGWAVAYVMAGAERTVSETMAREGCEVYLPLMVRRVRPAGCRRPTEAEAPLFPGYLFVDYETLGPPWMLHDEERFICFLGSGGEITLLCDEIIEQVRAIERDWAPLPEPEQPEFMLGEVVKVPAGPLAGYTGKVVRINGKRVLLDGMEFGRAMWFPAMTLVGGA